MFNSTHYKQFMTHLQHGVVGRPAIWITVEQGPIALAVGAVGVVWTFYSHLSFLSSFSLSLGDGPIKTEILSQRAVEPKTTNQPTNPYNRKLWRKDILSGAKGGGEQPCDCYCCSPSH